jgi:hypothetical protein
MSTTLTHPLSLGSSGTAVRALQTQLNASQLALGPKLSVDGSFGKVTHIAVIAFQRRKGLKADGVVGAKTARALAWNYQPVNEKPYIVRYDKPPLPAATPPLAVVAEAIRAGMDPLTEKLADDLWVAFNDPNNDPNYRTLMGKAHAHDPSLSQKQNRQIILRIKDLIFHYKKFSEVLSQLGDLSASNPEIVPSRLRGAFKEFVNQIISACNAMDFYYGITEHCRKRLNRLPYESIVGKVESVLKGDRTVTFAVAEIQMLFQTMAYAAVFDRSKVVDRPTLDWLERFEYHLKPNFN